MDTREQRDLEIAATLKIRRNGTAWIVPSQSGNGGYMVDLELEHCTCPDREVRRVKCKHIFAVEFTTRRETNGRGDQHFTLHEVSADKAYPSRRNLGRLRTSTPWSKGNITGSKR